MIPITCTTHSAEQTEALGRALGGLARARDVIALIGELGAGKTRFTRGVASALHIPAARVASPTYVLMHEYEPDPDAPPGAPLLVHVDAYRLTSLADLESAGYSQNHLEELRNGAIVLIEWADRLADELERESLIVRLSHVGENSRHVILELPDSWNDRMPAVLAAIGDQAMTPSNAPVPQPPQNMAHRACPGCHRQVAESEPTFPFCSKRCKLLDLARWAQGDYKITRPADDSDFEET
jgi:tRNA threonylcarbamoyladenosine biosynthesis protein TsaE